jgi:hypothetical protein
MQTPQRWIDRSQPQTLQVATTVLYVFAAFDLLSVFQFGVGSLLFVGLIAAQVAAGLGIASDRKWGWWLGLAAAIVPVVGLIISHSLGRNVLSLIFQVALIVALVHPQSREYKRIWFR